MHKANQPAATETDLDHAHACIADELNEVERIIRQQLGKIGCTEDLLQDILEAFFRGGGKRLRPRLVLLSALGCHGQALSGPTRDAVLNLAVIVELVHSASLMHDDVLDRADTRRGIPSLNAEFGDKIAILAGDILYSHAFEMLTETVDTDIMGALTRCVRRMCRGEIVNLACRGAAAYESVIEDKTALLMEFCCESGARLVRQAGATPDRIDMFRHFGHSFGMVYQLADDLDDNDVSPAAATRAQIQARLHDYHHRATAALKAMPRSPYRDGLAALLRRVSAGSERPTSQKYPTTALAGAYA